MAKCEVIKPEPVDDEYVLRLNRKEALLVLGLVGDVAHNKEAEAVYAAMRSQFHYADIPDFTAEVEENPGQQVVRGGLICLRVKA